MIKFKKKKKEMIKFEEPRKIKLGKDMNKASGNCVTISKG